MESQNEWLLDPADPAYRREIWWWRLTLLLLWFGLTIMLFYLLDHPAWLELGIFPLSLFLMLIITHHIHTRRRGRVRFDDELIEDRHGTQLEWAEIEDVIFRNGVLRLRGKEGREIRFRIMFVANYETRFYRELQRRLDIYFDLTPPGQRRDLSTPKAWLRFACEMMLLVLWVGGCYSLLFLLIKFDYGREWWTEPVIFLSVGILPLAPGVLLIIRRARWKPRRRPVPLTE